MSELTANEIDALLEALREGPSETDCAEGMTATEIAAHFGWTIFVARKRISQLLKEGRARCIQVRRARMDGQVQKVPAYRIS